VAVADYEAEHNTIKRANMRYEAVRETNRDSSPLRTKQLGVDTVQGNISQRD